MKSFLSTFIPAAAMMLVPVVIFALAMPWLAAFVIHYFNWVGSLTGMPQ